MRTLKIFLLALFFLPLSALATPAASDASDPNSLMAEALEAPLRSIDAAIKSIENGDSPMLLTAGTTNLSGHTEKHMAG